MKDYYPLIFYLGGIQGFTPPYSFILGRGWKRERTVDKQKLIERGSSCLEVLGPVFQNGSLKKRPISEWVDEAADWVRRVRLEGEEWQLLPRPAVPELYPNMGNGEDAPWHHVAR